jgi:hypothetical protein
MTPKDFLGAVMPRAIKVLSGPRHHGPIADTLILNLDQRRTHRGFGCAPMTRSCSTMEA